MKKIILALMAIVVLGACSLPNTNPPEYIKQFTVYKEGDGLVIYFILADSSGQMTTCDGEAVLIIKKLPSDFDEIQEAYEKLARKLGVSSSYLSEAGKREALERAEEVIFDKKYSVKKESFINTKIGRGAFESSATLFPFGRIPYNLLGKYTLRGKGKAELTFTHIARPGDTGGRTWQAQGTFYF